MSKNHDENKDLRLVSRIAKIDYSNKTIQASKSTIIGNKTWGRIDYLTHYCGWTFIWNNEVRISGHNMNSDDDTTTKRKRDAKKAKTDNSLTNKKEEKIMVKVFNPIFTINIASKPKRKSKLIGNNISRKCYAVVKKIDGEFKAVININKQYIRLKEGDELSNEQLILPFTERSLDLKDKIYVFLKEKDKYGHYVCIIRNTMTANLSPGLPTQYNTVHENLLLAGHIIRKNGKMYFEYEDLVAYHYLSESRICDVKVDNTKPLFNK